MKKELKIPPSLLNQLRQNNINPSDLVFYVSSLCNLRCKHCYIGNELLNQNQYFELADSVAFINSFSKLDRITILGGEPFLYLGFAELLNSLNTNLINEFRITSNLTDIKLYKDINDVVKRKLRICVSIDGHNSEIHDLIRGKGTFVKTVNNLKTIIDDNVDVEVTHTIMTKNIIHFQSFIELCKELGVKRINLHRMSLQGNALDNATLQVTPTDYVTFCKQLKSLHNDNGKISIRFPILFANDSTYKELVSEQSYQPHSCKSFYGDNQRIVIYPNRQIFISSELFGTESYIGTFDDNNFYFNNESKNELLFFQKESASISDLNPMQSGDDNYPFVLSVSFKETVKV